MLFSWRPGIRIWRFSIGAESPAAVSVFRRRIASRGSRNFRLTSFPASHSDSIRNAAVIRAITRSRGEASALVYPSRQLAKAAACRITKKILKSSARVLLASGYSIRPLSNLLERQHSRPIKEISRAKRPNKTSGSARLAPPCVVTRQKSTRPFSRTPPSLTPFPKSPRGSPLHDLRLFSKTS